MTIQREYQYFGGQPWNRYTTGRQYPEVDTTMFTESADAFKQLLRDASTVLDKLADDKNFAYKVMNAAQHSETEKVVNLIESTGIKSDVTTKFNPDELIMKFNNQSHGTDCCILTMALKW
ncbi:hypothetical protein [Bacillus pinisoli]|uniref:hypothetical protein n=1 Tax=Bacillus pinisoli TaxID=2901866 RepID=UPI001FF2FB0A|nr:hypothetical protein [Bacillus pinisoli]